MNEIIIGKPETYYLTQQDNKLHPFVTCFPTSEAMVIKYLLNENEKPQTLLGIPEDMQIEDYITQTAKTQKIINWMFKNVGDWTHDYAQKAWTVAYVEEKIFDDIIKPLGNYDAVFHDVATLEDVHEALSENNTPCVLFGNFGSVSSSVKGHINCCVGVNLETREVINNDPYGNALNNFNPPGIAVRYKWDEFFIRGKKRSGEKFGWLMEYKRK